MPLLDLVTSWVAVVSAGGDATARFRARHAALLERVRRQAAPDRTALPLLPHGLLLDLAVRQAHDATTLDALEHVERAAAALGADVPHTTVLLAQDGPGESMLALPGDPSLVVLSLAQRTDATALSLAKVRGQALLTRWSASEGASPLRTVAQGMVWDRWELARTTRLREWLYASGVATHLAAAVLPTLAPHQLLGLKRGELARLRERERPLRDLLATEMDHTGLGPLLRWLIPETPAGLRTTTTQIIPPGAGNYLAWRMTAERVERVGLREALRLEA